MRQDNTKKVRLPILCEHLNILLGDMSTTEFAEKVGVTRQTMGFYLNGNRIPDSETLIQICKRCNVSADWLLGLSEDPSPKPRAVDELGLSPKSVERISSIRSCRNADDVLQGLNMLLSDVNIIAISEGIKKYSDAIKSEKDHFENARKTTKISAKSVASTVKDQIALDDLYTADALTEEIVNAHPELQGRVAVICGQLSLEKKLKVIMEGFECAVNRVSGYYEYLSSQWDR